MEDLAEGRHVVSKSLAFADGRFAARIDTKPAKTVQRLVILYKE